MQYVCDKFKNGVPFITLKNYYFLKELNKFFVLINIANFDFSP